MKLFEPFVLGNMTLKNRLVMAPMLTNFGTDDGYVTDRVKAYYEARAEGGVGLIILEGICPDAVGKRYHHQLMISDDKYIPGLQEMARSIHKHGAKVALQLYHSGRTTRSKFSGYQPVAPSPIPAPGGEMPRELAVDEIKTLVRRFAEGAVRVKKAGIDAIEIQAAHGQILSQFLSSPSNARQDEYGGDLKNRARLLLDIMAAIREAVGESYPVWCRTAGREFGAKGVLSAEEAQEVARMCQRAGAVAMHVSVYSYGIDPRYLPSAAHPEGNILRFAESIKQTVTIPVIAVGRITPVLGEKVLQEGKADLIAIGTALITDPQLPNKVAEGRLDDIRPCLYCATCTDSINALPPGEMYCRSNPAVGRESEVATGRADRARNVVVIGGGPAGMEAAAIAARRGHRVTLFEQAETLGGQMIIAAVPPYKNRVAELDRFLRGQLDKAGVRIETRKEVRPAEIASIAPDVVLLATGVVPFIPDIPGIHGKNVVMAGDVLSHRTQVGEKVVVIGGELVGCETAEFLTDAGKKVTVTTLEPAIAESVCPAAARDRLVGRLANKGVTMLAGVRYHEITENNVVVTSQEGEKRSLPADTVVVAAGSRPNSKLTKALEGKVPELHQIGDCVKPGSLVEALGDALSIGLKL